MSSLVSDSSLNTSFISFFHDTARCFLLPTLAAHSKRDNNDTKMTAFKQTVSPPQMALGSGSVDPVVSSFVVAWALCALVLLVDGVAPWLHVDPLVMAVCLIFFEGPHMYLSFVALRCSASPTVWSTCENRSGDLKNPSQPSNVVTFAVRWFRPLLWAAEVVAAFVVWFHHSELFFTLLTYRAIWHNISQSQMLCSSHLWAREALPVGTQSILRWTFFVGHWVPLLVWWADDHRGLDWFHWTTDHVVEMPPFVLPIAVIGACVCVSAFLSCVVLWHQSPRCAERSHALWCLGHLLVTVATWCAGLHITDHAASFVLLTVPHAVVSMRSSVLCLRGSHLLSTTRRKITLAAMLGLCGLFENWLVEFFVQGPHEFDAFFLFALPQLLHMQMDSLVTQRAMQLLNEFRGVTCGAAGDML